MIKKIGALLKISPSLLSTSATAFQPSNGYVTTIDLQLPLILFTKIPEYPLPEQFVPHHANIECVEESY